MRTEDLRGCPNDAVSTHSCRKIEPTKIFVTKKKNKSQFTGFKMKETRQKLVLGFLEATFEWNLNEIGASRCSFITSFTSTARPIFLTFTRNSGNEFLGEMATYIVCGGGGYLEATFEWNLNEIVASRCSDVTSTQDIYKLFIPVVLGATCQGLRGHTCVNRNCRNFRESCDGGQGPLTLT